MRDRMYWRKMTAALGIAAALAAGCAAGGLSTTAWATTASCVADNIVVRESAVDGAQVDGLSQGQEVTIVDETTGSDGRTWYQITYEVDGTERTGWVRGDLITGETASADSEETTDAEEDAADDTEGTADETVSEEAASLVFTTQSGTVTLTMIPDEELALVSDRFAATTLDFAEGTINALQLLEPDELVADDAAIVDFYYVYGQNEIGETGWYVYNIEDGSLQKNLLNMTYSIPVEEETDEDTELTLDSTVRMIGSALAVICLLLLVLVIIMSVRYRRLKILYDAETDAEWLVLNKPESEEPEVKKKKHRGEPVVEEVPVQEESAESEIKGVSVLNLDLMEDEDYEALLNQYLDETEEKITDEIPAAAQESTVEVSEDTVSASESAEEAVAEEMKETPQETAAANEDEPEFYDDEDEDLEFL
ncbi:MAG: SH3 domain-containing protein, partial [Lachnospiraceae bacterium]|nr:SH3 domain-containing protein [Lachnospiraceae bacterium]